MLLRARAFSDQCGVCLSVASERSWTGITSEAVCTTYVGVARHDILFLAPRRSGDPGAAARAPARSRSRGHRAFPFGNSRGRSVSTGHAPGRGRRNMFYINLSAKGCRRLSRALEVERSPDRDPRAGERHPARAFPVPQCRLRTARLLRSGTLLPAPPARDLAMHTALSRHAPCRRCCCHHRCKLAQTLTRAREVGRRKYLPRRGAAAARGGHRCHCHQTPWCCTACAQQPEGHRQARAGGLMVAS